MDHKVLACTLFGVIVLLQEPRKVSSAGQLPGNSLARLSDIEEVCESNVFQPKCGPNEVIVMIAARYGRMKIGHCVKKNLGYIGCYSNVLTPLDQKCSGKNECELRVPHAELDATKPCLDELRTYLEAQYKCVQVMQPSSSCSNTKQWTLNNPAGYISNYVAQSTNCGTMTSPLIITALQGQRINITLYNFDPLGQQSSRDYIPDTDPDCEAYAHIIDKAAERSIPVCRGGPRIKSVYVSANRSIELVLYKTRSDGYQHGPFLIYYEAVGCRDISPPEGMWVRRRDSEAQVGCHVTREQWTLVCVHGKWLGEYSNCSKSMVLKPGDQKHSHVGLSHGVSVIIIVTIAIGIGIVVLLCGIFVIKRMRKGNGSESDVVAVRHMDEAEELEQLKVNYDNDMRSCSKPNDPEILQHVIYDKSKKDHTGYSPLHTCMHDAAHVQLRGPEVIWKANTHMNQCDYEARKPINAGSANRDNVAFVQPCPMSNTNDSSCKTPDDDPSVSCATNPSSTPNIIDSSTLNCSHGRSMRSFHDTVYGDRAGCVHTTGRDRQSRNPRNIYEPRRTRVLYTLNNSF